MCVWACASGRSLICLYHDYPEMTASKTKAIFWAYSVKFNSLLFHQIILCKAYNFLMEIIGFCKMSHAFHISNACIWKKENKIKIDDIYINIIVCQKYPLVIPLQKKKTVDDIAFWKCYILLKTTAILGKFLPHYISTPMYMYT